MWTPFRSVSIHRTLTASSIRVHTLAPTFGGINLEDISSPRCIEIEERLASQLDIPVFHDDQHGTAIVVMAALRNALRVVGKQPANVRVTINGAGAAGIAIAKLLLSQGIGPVVVCDRRGAIYRGRTVNMNSAKEWIAENTNHDLVMGTLNEALAGADVFIGVSTANALSTLHIRQMVRDPIVFALANPDPEIAPEEAAASMCACWPLAGQTTQIKLTTSCASLGSSAACWMFGLKRFCRK